MRFASILFEETSSLTYPEITANMQLNNDDAARTLYVRALRELRKHTGLAETGDWD